MHHSFDIELATKYGIEEAILIHHFRHWISINQRLKRNFHEGRTWTYQTLDEIAACFPYLNKSKVVDLVERLCTGKSRKSKKDEPDFEPILIKGTFNKAAYDRTTWYAFVEEPREILGNPNMSGDTRDIGKSQNGSWEIPTPIPDTIPYTETRTTTGQAPDGAVVVSSSSNESKAKASDLVLFISPEAREDLMSIEGMSHDLLKSLAARYSCEQIHNARLVTEQANPDLPIAFFRKALEDGYELPVKKTKEDYQKLVEKHFDEDKTYNHANCQINKEGITFYRGNKSSGAKFDSPKFMAELRKILEDFNIDVNLT